MIRRVYMSILPAFSVAMIAMPGHCQPCSPSQAAMLVADDGDIGDGYGWAVAIDGGTAVVGSLHDNGSGNDTGSVYVLGFDGASWDQAHKIVATGLGTSDGFGDCVAISGNTIVVGTPGDDDAGSGAGAAYVFELVKGQWMQQAKLVPAALLAGDNFASSVGIDGDTIVLGASLTDTQGASSGKAYVYRRVDGVWGLEAELYADDAEMFDRLGLDVAVSGDRIVAGVDSDDDLGSASGSVIVFDRVGTVWTQSAKLLASDGAEDDQFGERVDISGDSIIVGARYDDDMGSRSGSAYIFEYDGSAWAQHTKLVAFDGAGSEYFGQDVAIHNGKAIVGAWGQNDQFGFFNAGAAYGYSRTNEGWQIDNKIVASDQEGGDFFGYRVAVSDEHAIIGADGNDDFWWGPDAGAVYLIALNCEESCLADLDGNGELNFFDVAEFLDAYAAMDSAADFTGDGEFNFFDVADFLDAYALGCSE